MPNLSLHRDYAHNKYVQYISHKNEPYEKYI